MQVDRELVHGGRVNNVIDEFDHTVQQELQKAIAITQINLYKNLHKAQKILLYFDSKQITFLLCNFSAILILILIFIFVVFLII
jgi:hypothetical protein